MYFVIGFAIQICRRDVTLSFGIRRGEENQIAWEAIFFVYPDNIAYMNIFRLDFLE